MQEVPTLTDILRGDRRRRPVADRRIAAGLRAELEDGIFELSREMPRSAELNVRPGDLRTHAGDATTTHPRLRGALVHELLRLGVSGHRVDDHFAEALAAWKSEHDDPAALDRLDADELARLATEVTAHGVTLERRLDVINPLWRPRTSVAIVQRLGGGCVVARDRIDLVVGTIDSPTASVALFDLTTSPLNSEHERVLRYHALMETLRSQIAPLRVATMSTATGDVWSLDVDRTMLRRAMCELAETIAVKWRSQ